MRLGSVGRVEEVNRSDLNSHADCCVCGKEVLVFNDFDREVTVTGWDPEGETQSLRIVSAAMGYTIPHSGQTVLLIANQSIFSPSLNHNLLSTMQMRRHYVIVNETPNFQSLNPTKLSHSISVRGDNVEDVLLIPLELHGVVACFPTFKPTQLEFETCDWYDLTYESPEYDPSATTFHEQEAIMMDSWVNVKVSGDFHPKRHQVCFLHQKEAEVKILSSKYSDTSAKLQDLSSVLDDGTLLAELDDTNLNLNISLVKYEIRDKVGVDSATLANKWGIGLEVVKRTGLVTTKRGIRRMIHPSLTKRYETNDRQLRYRRLPVTMYTDTMFSTILSRQKNKAAHIFCTVFGFVRAFKLKKEKEAREALSLLFHRDGVPNVMVMDGSNAQVEGEFRRKLCDAGCHIKQTEPQIQSSNMGEGAVRGLKKGVGRQRLRSGFPKRFWGDCIIREAYVRSHTSLDIYGLEGQVPESKIKADTVDISTIAEYAWYEWVTFSNTAAKFPMSKIQLGRDMGAAIDIGHAMTRKILKQNGSFMYRSSVRPLTQDEIQSPTEKKEREVFDIAIEKKFGPDMNKDDFQNDPDYADFVTPTYDFYEDDELFPSKMPDIDDIKEEHDVDTYDQYVGAHVRVPIGDEIRYGKVVWRKCELDGTVRGRANAKSMLDTRTYEIEFHDGRSDEYTANMIAENMYAQCDIEGRQYNLMEGIIDQKTDGHAVSPADMYIKHGSNNKVRKTTKGWHLCV
jgi:hypothetical protein